MSCIKISCGNLLFIWIFWLKRFTWLQFKHDSVVCKVDFCRSWPCPVRCLASLSDTLTICQTSLACLWSCSNRPNVRLQSEPRWTDPRTLIGKNVPEADSSKGQEESRGSFSTKCFHLLCRSVWGPSGDTSGAVQGLLLLQTLFRSLTAFKGAECRVDASVTLNKIKHICSLSVSLYLLCSFTSHLHLQTHASFVVSGWYVTVYNTFK